MNERFQKLCRDYKIQTAIDPRLYDKYNVKRGLRNNDGSGVVVGLTNICCVHGYVIDEGEKRPAPGQLIYRGYDICDLISGVEKDGRYGFEETAYLLLFGNLPDKEHLEDFKKIVTHYRTLPPYFAEDVLMRCPSSNIMNKMAQSVLALYTYDKEPENKSMESEMLKAISVIARLPAIMVGAYQVMRRYLYNSSMVMHPINLDESLAESILSTLRDNREYTKEEAKLLDLCLMLHAEHGGGNNSSFTVRVTSSSGTDTYSAIAAAVSSLKGPRHGGANLRVVKQFEEMKENIHNWKDETEVGNYLRKILNKEAGDGSGLIYGMGHAIYTLSDPRAVALKKAARPLAEKTGYSDEMDLIELVEKLTPGVFAEIKGSDKPMCANVDMYSGFVYKMLGLPKSLYTPLFATARIVGWMAHRLEEVTTGGKIIRPAYKPLAKATAYTNIDKTVNDYTMPKDEVPDRLMVEVHFYDPYQFTMMNHDETWSNVFLYWGKDNHVSGSIHNATGYEEDYVKQQFQKMKTAYADKGIPVIVGEYSAMKRAKEDKIEGTSELAYPDIDQEMHNKSRSYWNEVVTREAKNHGCVPFYWETGGDMNRGTGTAKEAYAIEGIMKGAAAGQYPY